MKKVLLLFALLLLIVGGLVFSQGFFKQGKNSFFKIGKNTASTDTASKNATASIGDHKFEVVIAKSQQEREKGLSQTESLQDNQGMLFLFEKSDYHFFWMKDMKFPIDIIFINNDTIVTITNNAVPPKNSNENPILYAPTQPTNKVLEINAGLSKKYNFKNGDKVKYENLGTESR